MKIIAASWLIIGALIILIYSMAPGQYLEQGLGLACILLGVGLLTLRNWARIAVIIFSGAFVLFYLAGIVEIFVIRSNGWQWGAMALTVFLPLFLFGIICIMYLNDPELKDLFKHSKV